MVCVMLHKQAIKRSLQAVHRSHDSVWFHPDFNRPLIPLWDERDSSSFVICYRKWISGRLKSTPNRICSCIIIKLIVPFPPATDSILCNRRHTELPKHTTCPFIGCCIWTCCASAPLLRFLISGFLYYNRARDPRIFVLIYYRSHRYIPEVCLHIAFVYAQWPHPE